MNEDAQTLFLRLRGIFLPFQRWAAPTASVLTLLAGFCHSRPLRVLILITAVFLFLVVVADIARSLLDQESSSVNLAGSPKDMPVSSDQIVLTVVIAGVYSAMILSGFYILLLQLTMAWFVLVPGTFLLSGLAAWHNVRL
jgi:hypothetical protein